MPEVRMFGSFLGFLALAWTLIPYLAPWAAQAMQWQVCSANNLWYMFAASATFFPLVYSPIYRFFLHAMFTFRTSPRGVYVYVTRGTAGKSSSGNNDLFVYGVFRIRDRVGGLVASCEIYKIPTAGAIDHFDKRGDWTSRTITATPEKIEMVYRARLNAGATDAEKNVKKTHYVAVHDLVPLLKDEIPKIFKTKAWLGDAIGDDIRGWVYCEQLPVRKSVISMLASSVSQEWEARHTHTYVRQHLKQLIENWHLVHASVPQQEGLKKLLNSERRGAL